MHHAVVEDRCFFDEIADAAAAQLAVLLRFRCAFGKPAPVGELQALVHDAHELAAVVGDAGMKLVRHGGRGHEVAPPDLDRIDADHARGAVEQLLDQIGRLRPSGAAIGLQRRRVGEHGSPGGVHRRDLIDAGRELEREQRHDHRRVEHVRAHVVQRIDAQAEDLAALVERELPGHDLIAAVRVAEKGFRAG